MKKFNAFKEVREVMQQPEVVQSIILSDEEIEALFHQPPLNQSPMLPAEEITEPETELN